MTVIAVHLRTVAILGVALLGVILGSLVGRAIYLRDRLKSSLKDKPKP
jgi:hypothetical protein